MNVYIITAYRFGDKESHSYVVGVFDNYKSALACAELEEDGRSGKYQCEVIEKTINDPIKRNQTIHLSIDTKHE